LQGLLKLEEKFSDLRDALRRDDTLDFGSGDLAGSANWLDLP
jgi:hypothetical protein